MIMVVVMIATARATTSVMAVIAVDSMMAKALRLTLRLNILDNLGNLREKCVHTLEYFEARAINGELILSLRLLLLIIRVNAFGLLLTPIRPIIIRLFGILSCPLGQF